MSDSGSDNNSGSSSSDNASYVAPAAQHSTLAALRAQTVQPLIHETGWYGSNDSDFQHRFAARGYSFPPSADSQPRIFKRTDSDTRSMAVVHSRSATLDSTSSTAYPPSLTWSSTAPSDSSARTVEADSILDQRLLEEVDGGALKQRLPSLPCPYSILRCTFASTDLMQWETHVRFHFQGALPKGCSCPFEGCTWSVTAAAPSQQAWDWRSLHIQIHRVADRVVVPVGPRHPDVEHLWRNRVISDAQLKELRQYGQLGADPGAYLSSARPEPERRRRQRAGRC